MKDSTYKALVVSETGEGTFNREVQTRSVSSLPPHEVLIEVHYSSLNYKDALSATGNKGVTRQFPHTPGIDAAGVVVESDSSRFNKGDKVIVTSFDLGQNTPGGFGQYISVPAGWIVPLPEGLSLKESMILGTAGFTAAYGVYKIVENGTAPEDGPLLVTGATGGVGSFAIALLSERGYEVTAATGKLDQQDYLKYLGARQVIGRDSVMTGPDKPLLKSKWAGALDTVGGAVLDRIIRQTKHNGTVACCGNVLGGHLNTSIYPFILRGVSLMGIDSGICLMPMRKQIWHLLATDWKIDKLSEMYHEATLDTLEKEIEKILKGKQVGRVLVNLKK